MQYANKKMLLRLQDFETIIEAIKSCKNKRTGGTLYGYENDRLITVHQISINENHDEYLASENINLLQTNDSHSHYIGEWFYHDAFKGWISEEYDKMMQKKSETASKVQEFKSTVVIGFNIIDGEIIVVAKQTGECFYSDDFESLIDVRYENITKTKSVATSKMQDHKPQGSNQLVGSVPLDLVVKGEDGLEYFNQGIKLVKSS